MRAGRPALVGAPALAAALALLLVLVLAGAMPAAAHPPPDAGSYAWVDPPPGIGDAPEATAREAVLTPDLLAAGSVDVWTPDLQAVATLRMATEVDEAVEVRLSPIAPADLPPLPAGAPNGNAYRLDLEGPSQVVADATVLLRAPYEATTVWRLDPGEQWTDLAVAPGPTGILAPAADGATLLAATDRLDGHGSWLGALVHDPARAAMLAGGLLLAVAGVVRARRRSATAAAPPVTARH